MREYSLIQAVVGGGGALDAGKVLMERGLALRVDQYEVWPMYLKNGQANPGSNEGAFSAVVDQSRLAEALEVMRSAVKGRPLRAVVLPVLTAIG
jgi:hypothetical protein